jgi:hypothetical protein
MLSGRWIPIILGNHMYITLYTILWLSYPVDSFASLSPFCNFSYSDAELRYVVIKRKSVADELLSSSIVGFSAAESGRHVILNDTLYKS